MSRTKAGERWSIAPGENASNKGSNSQPRPDEVNPLPYMPNEQGFSVVLRWFRLDRGDF